MCEIVAVRGYENYGVDSNGNVFNTRTGRQMKLYKTACGYLQVSLCKDGVSKTFLVHRLVALAFIPNRDNLPEVNHKDENKENNSVDNLEWCTHDYNSRYGENAPTKQWRYMLGKYTPSKPVCQMDLSGNVLAVYPSTIAAEEHTGVGHSNIQRVCNPKYINKTAGGYRWRYESEEAKCDYMR